MIRWLASLWLKLRVVWSNYKNRNNIVNLYVDEKIYSPYELTKWAREWYNNFDYTYDGINDLFDSMRYPAECYYRIKTSVFKDDCDGFHAALYHVVTENNLNAYLLTYVDTKIINSHTVLLIKYFDRYFLFDYDNMISDNTLDGLLIKQENRRKVKILKYNLVVFNYTKGKYEIVKEEV